MQYDVIVVGGGASGLIAAIVAARKKKRILILEQKNKLGKKLLATGNGKCNYTNELQTEECYRSNNQTFPMEVLSYCSKEDVKQFFLELGVYPKIKKGYYYPYSEQASAILEALCLELKHQKVTIITDACVKGIQKKKIFQVTYKMIDQNKEQEVFGKKVIISTGGMASSKLGSDGSGYFLAKEFGHKITSLAPALIGLKAKETYFKALAGLRMEAHICLFIKKQCVIQEIGEVQFTNYGISGIPVFQISRYATLELLKENVGKICCKMDFFPQYTSQELTQLLKAQKKGYYKRAEDYFVGLIPKKLIQVILKHSKISMETQISNFTNQDWNQICQSLKAFTATIYDSNGFENAQVTAGGIDTKYINSKTLESTLVRGLYLTGEVLDVDGMCGGYNLQWAWSTGILAGMSAATEV